MSKSTNAAEIKISSLSPIDDLMDRCERMMSQYWAENPDLYQIIQAKKQRPEESKPVKSVFENSTSSANDSPGKHGIN